MQGLQAFWDESLNWLRRVAVLDFRRKNDEVMPLPIKRGSRVAVRTASGVELTPNDQANLRLFRQVVVELRSAMALERGTGEDLHVVNGYMESDAERNRIRKLCVPVRRGYLASDPVNLNRIMSILLSVGDGDGLENARTFDRQYDVVRNELASVSILNDRRVEHREMFEVWIDAQVFYEEAEKVRKYNAVVHELGKAVEGIGLHIAELFAQYLLVLDDLVADFLGQARGNSPAEEEAQAS